MDSKDFAQYLLKLDRNKAPIKAKSRNTPVWQIQAVASSTTVDGFLVAYDATDVIGAYPKWDGTIRWNGEFFWAAEAP